MAANDNKNAVERDREEGEKLSSWVEDQLAKEQAAFEQLTPDEKELALARLLVSCCPIQGIIGGDKK